MIPTGGQATRIAPLPCSKELFPLGFSSMNSGQEVRPKVACHYLLEKMRLAGIKKIFIVLREEKWDIPAYFRDGAAFDVHLAYLIMNLSFLHKPELFVGDIVQAAIGEGFRVEAVHVFDEPFLDIGTPDDLIRAVKLSVPSQNSH